MRNSEPRRRTLCMALIATLVPAALVHADVIAAWDFSGLTAYGPSPDSATAADANVTVVGLTRGSGVTTSGTAAGSAWGGNGFTSTDKASAVSAGDFATFSLTANTGYLLSLSDIAAYNIRRSGTGPSTGVWQYSTDGTSFTDIGTPITWGATTTGTGNSELSISLSGISALQNVAAGTTITFRIVNWGGASGGTWYFNNFQSGNDLIVNGAASVDASGTPVPLPASVGMGGVALAGLGLTASLRRRRRGNQCA